MSEAPDTRPARDRWRGAQVTPAVINSLSPTEARIYSAVAWHAATRTRISFATLGLIQTPQGTPLGWFEARMIVADLHDRGLVLVVGWKDAERDTPLAFYLSRMPSPHKAPIHLRLQEGRVPVGGKLTAPATLDPELLRELQVTGERLVRHHAPQARSEGVEWLEGLAECLEARAAALHRWATIDAAPLIRREADRLTDAAGYTREQIEHRLRAAARQAPS